jgi:hypothetical protein
MSGLHLISTFLKVQPVMSSVGTRDLPHPLCVLESSIGIAGPVMEAIMAEHQPAAAVGQVHWGIAADNRCLAVRCLMAGKVQQAIVS